MRQTGLRYLFQIVSELLANVGNKGHDAGTLDSQAGGTLEGGTAATSLA